MSIIHQVIKRLALSLSLLGICTAAFAAPNNISVPAGTYAHKGTMVISGADFGTKSPAAPRIWDACDDDSTSSLSTFWPTDTYPSACEGGETPSETPYLMDYRESFHGFSTMPNSHVTKFLSAAAITCDGVWDSPQADNLVTSAPWSGDTLYITYYFRMPGSWSSDISGSGDNLKIVSSNGSGCPAPGSYLCGSDNYLDYDNGRTPMIMNPNDPDIRGCETSPSCDPPRAGPDNGLYHNNPMQGWVHFEHRWGSTSYMSSWSDGSESGDQGYPAIKTIRTDGSSPVAISLGGFTRFPRSSATGNYRLWAAIYADNTYSRVMLGNASTWANCTIREPQIPSEWASDEITVSVNQGSLSDGTAYLYVFDSANDSNATGIAITLGDSGETPASISRATVSRMAGSMK